MAANIALLSPGDFLLSGLAGAGQQLFDRGRRDLLPRLLCVFPYGHIRDPNHLEQRLRFLWKAGKRPLPHEYACLRLVPFCVKRGVYLVHELPRLFGIANKLRQEIPGNVVVQIQEIKEKVADQGNSLFGRLLLRRADGGNQVGQCLLPRKEPDAAVCKAKVFQPLAHGVLLVPRVTGRLVEKVQDFRRACFVKLRRTAQRKEGAYRGLGGVNGAAVFVKKRAHFLRAHCLEDYDRQPAGFSDIGDTVLLYDLLGSQGKVLGETEEVVRRDEDKLHFEAIANYAGNAFCEKSWDMITKSNPFNIAEANGGRAMSNIASFFGRSKITILGGTGK